jgi:hypothetical protein
MNRILLAVFILAATIAASPAPFPSLAPSPKPTPQRVALGQNVQITNVDEPDANGTFHCEYLSPAQRVILGVPVRIVWWCAR